MRHTSNGIAMAVAAALLAGAASGAAGPPSGPISRCPVDAVVSGTVCMDKYEASVWHVPNATTANRSLVARIRRGMATAADMAAGGATQLGVICTDDYAPCADSGQNCANDVYAVSLPGVMPSANLTWFQAQAACTNAGKRLPSNAEWQAAVAGGAGRPHEGLQHAELDGGPDGIAGRLRVVGRGLRHGGQRPGVRGRLGGATDQRVHSLDARHQYDGLHLPAGSSRDG